MIIKKKALLLKQDLKRFNFFKLLFNINTLAYLLLFFSLFFLYNFIPENMDEFLPYHRLACEYYQFSSENIFVEPCDSHKSKIFNYEYFRNYNYVGVISSVIYKPFFIISKTVASHYFYSTVLFLFFCVFLIKSFKFKRTLIIIPLIYFPLMFQFVHDTGPIKISMISSILIIYCIYEILNKEKKFFYYIIILIFLFISMEDKIFIIFIFPQILIISFWFSFLDKKKINYNNIDFMIFSKFILENKYKILSIITLFLFSIILFLFIYKVNLDNKYVSYYKYLINDNSSSLSFGKELLYIIAYSFSPILFTSKIIQLTLLEILISSTFFCLTFFILFKPFKIKNFNIKYKILISSYTITAVIFLIFKSTWTGHHFIFLHLPIIIGLCVYANKNEKNLKNTIIFLIVGMLFTISQLYFSKVYDYSDKSKTIIFDKLKEKNIAENSVINFSTWGGYYIQSLYGYKNQLITYTDQFNDNEIKDLEKIKINNKRNFIINVCFNENEINNCTYDFIREKFKDYKFVEPLTNNQGIWKAWKIY